MAMATKLNILLFVSVLLAAAAFSNVVSRQTAGSADYMYPQGRAYSPGSKYTIQLDVNTYLIDGRLVQKGTDLYVSAPSPAPSPAPAPAPEA